MTFLPLALHSLMVTEGQQMRFKYNSYRDNKINGSKMKEVTEALNKLKENMMAFGENEVRQFFINVDPNWSIVFDKFNKDDIKNFALSPVGSYFGTRKLSKILNQVIPLSVFYKE